MKQEDLKKLINARVDELPTLPAVLPKILKMVEDESTTIDSLTKVISRDQALTSKVLKVANSAYYGFPGTIESLRHAVALLGFNMVKSLTLSIGVMRALPDNGQFSQFSQSGLWEHSLAVATALELIGEQLNENREDLFTIGLLHDVGIVVQVHFFTDLFADVLRLIHEEDMDQLDAERQVFGFDHGEMSRIVLERWHFPESIIYPIAMHHSSRLPENGDSKTVAMLRIANTLPTRMDIGVTGLNYNLEILPTDMDELGMSEEDLAELRSKLENSREEIKSFTETLQS